MNNVKFKKALNNALYNIYLSYIPNKRDNLKQIILKVVFIASLASLIVSSVFIINYFSTNRTQDNIIEDTREIWHSAETQENGVVSEQEQAKVVLKMFDQNPDFKGWISLSGTKIDHPIYQTDNNDFYLNHNGNKQKSSYGALYFDYQNVIEEGNTDKNLVIFGHDMKNGAMFGTLERLRSYDFYKQNPTIEFSTIYDKANYHIYSIFVLNANKADDNDYIYNIYRKNFASASDFDNWVAEAMNRSIISTGIDVRFGDDIITLVTCCDDFPNARLVVMARKVRSEEAPFADTSHSFNNPNPRYPARWYTERGLEYPFKEEK